MKRERRCIGTLMIWPSMAAVEVMDDLTVRSRNKGTKQFEGWLLDYLELWAAKRGYETERLTWPPEGRTP